MEKTNISNNYKKIILIGLIAILMFLLLGVHEVYIIKQFNQYAFLIEENYDKERILCKMQESFRNRQLAVKHSIVIGESIDEILEEFIDQAKGYLEMYERHPLTINETLEIQLIKDELENYYNLNTQYNTQIDSNNYSKLRNSGNKVITSLENLIADNVKDIERLSKTQDKYYPSLMNNVIRTILGAVLILSSLTYIAVQFTKRNDLKVFKLAYYDSLTGLANRSYFMYLASNAMRKLNKGKRIRGFLLIDAHTISNIDGTFGSKVGDHILEQIGNRLTKEYNQPFIIGRLGGCVFIMLTPNLSSLYEITDISQSVIELLNKPFIINDYELNIDVNIGISLIPIHGLDVEELEKKAGNALTLSKKEGKNIYKYFDEDIEIQIMKELELEQKLKLAIVNSDFSLHYQPILNANTNIVNLFEVLIRWKDNNRMIPPMEFLPIAEKKGYIIEIGLWVIRNACYQLAIWNQMGYKLSISINVSPIQFQDNSFVLKIKQIFEETKINPEDIILEVTENIFIDNFDLMVKKIKEIKSLGVHIALDDFGTGYSSLGYLKKLTIDFIKIDKLFVQSLNNLDEPCFLSEIISISQKLGLRVIAEGVETEGQFNTLKNLKVDYLQGYKIGKPKPADEISFL